jgi:hypothetical protein
MPIPIVHLVGCAKLQRNHLEESVYSVETLIYFLFRWVFGGSNRFISSSRPSRPHLGPTQLPVKCGWDMALITHLHLAQRLRRGTALPLLLFCASIGMLRGDLLLNTQLYTLRFALVWEITQSIVVVFTDVSRHPIGPFFKDSWPLKMGTVCCPETSLKNAWIWDGRFSRIVGKELQLYAAQFPRRARISSASWRKPEITQLHALTVLESVSGKYA